MPVGSVKRLARIVRFRLYPTPVLIRRYIRDVSKRYMAVKDGEEICIDIGGGASPYREDVRTGFAVASYYSIDIAASDATSVVADAQFLPVRSGSVAYVVSFETLQHIPDVAKAFDEITRVLKVGGLFLVTFPFLFGECETVDCTRWTIQGMERELTRRGFRVLDARRKGGLFFAVASGLHLAIQLVLPGGRGDWRRRPTGWGLVRYIIVTVMSIPTALIAWVALGLDTILNVRTLAGFYQGALLIAERLPSGSIKPE